MNELSWNQISQSQSSFQLGADVANILTRNSGEAQIRTAQLKYSSYLPEKSVRQQNVIVVILLLLVLLAAEFGENLLYSNRN